MSDCGWIAADPLSTVDSRLLPLFQVGFHWQLPVRSCSFKLYDRRRRWLMNLILKSRDSLPKHRIVIFHHCAFCY